MREPFFRTRTRRAIEDDARDELESWIDERADALSAEGLAPGDARRRALEEFGDLPASRQYAERQDIAADRGVRFRQSIEELGSDIRIAARTLARTPAVTAVVLLTFALGIGAATAVFSVVHALLIRPLPYGHEAALVQLQPVEHGVVRPEARYSAAALVALRDRTTAFTAIAAIGSGNTVLRDNGDPEQVVSGSVALGVFDVLQAQASIGRTFTIADESSPIHRGVVLLDGLWRRRFGADPAIIGRTIAVGADRREVIGVMPAAFRVPTYEAVELITAHELSSILQSRTDAHVRVHRLLGRLKPGVSEAAAQADVDRVMRNLQLEFPRAYDGLGTRVVPIRAAVAGAVRPRLLVLMGAAVFVLLIACANVAGILLSRALARRRELAVRMALGAGRMRLARQFLAEGAVLALLGAALGLFVAEGGVIALRQMAGAALPAGTTFALEPRVLAFAIAAAMLSAFASAMVPALRATRTAGVALTRDEGRASASRAGRRLRLALVAAQLAISVVLLVGAGLFVRALMRLSTLDVGYATESALTFRPAFGRTLSAKEQDAFWAALFDELRALPGVIAIGVGNIPMSGQSTVTGLEVEGRTITNGRLPEVRYTFASDEYFAALGIPLVRGRVFNAADRAGAPAVAVISAGLAKQLWPDSHPIGARLKTAPTKPWATIVGIVGDVRSGSADAPVPSVYSSHRQDPWPGGGAVVLRTAGDPVSLAAAIPGAMRRVDPTMPIVGLRTLDELRRTTPAIAERRLQMQLLSVFALVALAVSAIGVYGVSAYATAARRREFGIRLALGSPPPRVLWLALADSARTAAIGVLIGLPVAWLLAARVRNLLFTVSPFDLPTIATALGVLAFAVVAASIVPARRATLIDPAQTMRTD